MGDAPATRPSLLVRLRNPRDGQAWAQFVDVYAPLVYAFALSQSLQDADAADLTQEVLRAVNAALGRFEYDPERGSFMEELKARTAPMEVAAADESLLLARALSPCRRCRG